MIGAIRDKSINIMVVEPVQSIRRLISSSIKDLGFSNIVSYESLKEAKKSIYRLGPKWIFTSLFERDSFNALSLLESCLKEDLLSECLVSVLVDASGQDILPEAFQLGLLSWHPQVTTAATLKDELNRILNLLQVCQWHLPAVASHYLFNLLASKKEFKDLESALTNILTLSPDNLPVALKLAETYFTQNKVDQAILMLRHVKEKSPAHKDGAEKLTSKYLGTSLTAVEASQSFAEKHAMRSAAIIDSDQATIKSLTVIFQDLGFTVIEGFGDGPSFFNWLDENNDVDIIVSEWKIPKTSGPAIIQRVRVDKGLAVPLIIHSSVVQDKDRILLKELGVTDVITKPMYQKLLGQELKAIIAADIDQSKSEIIVTAIRSALRKKDYAAAQVSLDSLKTSDAPSPLKNQMEAEVLLAVGEPALAKNLAVTALNVGGESLDLLDLLGRILLKLREFELAKKFLDKAAKISPDNIERLCLQAETAYELGDLAQVDSSFTKAAKVDEGSKVLLESKATIATDQGHSDLAKSFISRLKSGDGVVARLNNRAVGLVQEGKRGEALELYKKGLVTIGENDPDLDGVLRYNMALSYIRSNRLKEAQATLAEIKDPKKSRVGSKVTSLKQRVDQSVASGTPLAHKGKEEEIAELEPIAAPFVPIYPNIRPGSRILYLLYQRSLPFSDKAEAMLSQS